MSTYMFRGSERCKDKARFGSAPDLRSASCRATLPVTALRRPLRRYALSVDEPPRSAVRYFFYFCPIPAGVKW